MTDDIEVEEKTTFTFDELSDDAKDKALDAERYSEGYLSYEWWDSTYEDAVRMATILGIQIDTTRHTPHGGRPFYSTDIHFSGFSSQGDGASFSGYYISKPDAATEMAKEAPLDMELQRIAAALTLMSITQRLMGNAPPECRITQEGRYSHSGTMDLASDYLDDVPESMEKDLLQLVRDFADWIYKQLGNEHDYLMSDEVVAEQLADRRFDESGSVI